MFGRKGQAVLSPAVIMGVVTSLIILAVGVYAFFTTTGMVPVVTPAQTTTGMQNSTYYAVQNVSGIGGQVFNVIGVVLVIGSIMLIVTMVYSYMRPQ